MIGNSSYQHTVELTNPRNDAGDIARELKRLGFHVISGFDLDKHSMDRKILEFAEALNGVDAGLFFYAGHGVQVSGQNYLVPVDAKLSTAVALDFEAVRLDLIQRTMERQTKTNLIFLDACRNNPLSRNLARAMGTRSTDIGAGLAPVESGFGTLVSFSTQPGNVALDGKGRNSPFADALIQQLASPSEDISTMLVNVRNAVMRATQDKQVPWEHSALRAKFYFQEPRTLSLEQALRMCVRSELHPAKGAIVERLAKQLRDRDYEYGWSGGVANKHDPSTKSVYEVTSVEVKAEQIEIGYKWQNGVLRLQPIAPFYGSRAVTGVMLRGTWTQDNGFGCVELQMEGADAEGRWSERVGNELEHSSFLRAKPQ